MFPLVHIYAAIEVSKKKTPLLVIGSVIPDMVWLDRKNLKPEIIHDNVDGFYSYLKSEQKEMLDLALGMKLHSNEVGADKYSHFYKGGYSYIKGKDLIPELEKLIDSNDKKKISDLSHNFIEAALDLNLLNNHLEILALYKDSASNVDLAKISKEISNYSKIDYELIYKAVQMLSKVISPKYFNSDGSMAKNIFPKLIMLSFGKEVDTKEVLKILKKAVEITKDDYEDLIDEMISEMKKDFPGA